MVSVRFTYIKISEGILVSAQNDAGNIQFK
uniref:Uncharacterized protein n=1 Tax=Anguilla anguilla TaxID=7936 RepID=A0A0E9U2I0_ANGAN